MKVSEMRQLGVDELQARVGEWRTELFHARCNKAVGQLGNTNQLPQLRRQIAQALTVINEKQREARNAAE